MRRIVAFVFLGSAALAGGLEHSPVSSSIAAHAHTAPNTSMAAQMQEMLATLRPLRGKAFDAAWTRSMIDHHQMALEMAQHELSMGRDPRVKAEAKKVVDAQKKEITTMQGWLKTWTGRSYAPKSMPMHMNNMQGSMDKWFLQEMIPHHQGALMMSSLISSHTQNSQLLALGRTIIRAQSMEIVRYRQLLQSVK